MRAIPPNADGVNGVLRRIASNSSPSNVELVDVLAKPPVVTGLDHWALWTLICLHRHLDRQRWVGFIVESRLKGELQRIGCAGAFGHPEALPQSGDVPDEPDWGYYFHGCGCCLTNKVTGASIDVDFTREGGSDRVDRFFYSNYLLSLSNPAFPERLIRRQEPLQHAWQVEIDRLSEANCVKAEHGLHLTTDGIRLAETIEPLTKQIAQLLEWGTIDALRNALYAALAIGDAVLASEISPQANVGAELLVHIEKRFEDARVSRFKVLQAALEDDDSYASCCLAAIADLGPQLAEESVVRRLFQSPVDGASNTALGIVRTWNRKNTVDILKDLLSRRYREATGVGAVLSRLFAGAKEQPDQQPRHYQVTQAVVALLQRVRSNSLEPQLKAKMRYLIENAGGAQAGEAALILYLLDQREGLRRLRQALSGSVPAAHKDAAAACVIIGSPETEQILKEGLKNSNPRIQHTTACALAVFESQSARALARGWFAQNDGIKDPLGEEVTVLGRTTSVFTFEDISHANMDEFFKWSLEKLRKDFASIL